MMIYHNYSYYSFYWAGQLLSGHDFWLSMLIALSMLIPDEGSKVQRLKAHRSDLDMGA
jgi:hypothetical protein